MSDVGLHPEVVEGEIQALNTLRDRAQADIERYDKRIEELTVSTGVEKTQQKGPKTPEVEPPKSLFENLKDLKPEAPEEKPEPKKDPKPKPTTKPKTAPKSQAKK